MRIHSSLDLGLVPRAAPAQPSATSIRRWKPLGLWYATDWEWLEWVRSEQPDWERPHHFDIEIDPAKVLILARPKDIIRFTDEYGVIRDYGYTQPHGFSRSCDHIDWPSVARSYSGIEISPYQHSLRLDFFAAWYYTWDIASGCIWNPDAILGITKVPDEAIPKPERVGVES
jgi:hypothetical protein